MQSNVAKSFISCALGIAMLAGCASHYGSSSSGASASQASASTASSQVQNGTVASIESATAAGMSSNYSSYPSSGGGVAGTTASGGQVITTVNFTDGTQGRFITDSPTLYKVGDPIQVVTRGNKILFMRR